jgi:hypothetical protein
MTLLVGFGDHLVNGQAVYGYGWNYVSGVLLFLPDPDASRMRLHIVRGEIVKVEGGELTDPGNRFFAAVAPTQFEIWSDNPVVYFRYQISENWGQVSRTDRIATDGRLNEAYQQLSTDVQIYSAPARS